MGVFLCSLSDYENVDFYLKRLFEIYRKIGDMENEGLVIC